MERGSENSSSTIPMVALSCPLCSSGLTNLQKYLEGLFCSRPLSSSHPVSENSDFVVDKKDSMCP